MGESTVVNTLLEPMPFNTLPNSTQPQLKTLLAWIHTSTGSSFRFVLAFVVRSAGPGEVGWVLAVFPFEGILLGERSLTGIMDCRRVRRWLRVGEAKAAVVGAAAACLGIMVCRRSFVEGEIQWLVNV